VAWEKRRGRGKYYTRTRRVGGSLVREYLGTGPEAERAAAEDAARRADNRALRTERSRLEAADAELDDLAETARAIAHAELLLGGFHQHDRGNWRRRRNP
jgi:hypothetical protein